MVTDLRDPSSQQVSVDENGQYNKWEPVTSLPDPVLTGYSEIYILLWGYLLLVTGIFEEYDWP